MSNPIKISIDCTKIAKPHLAKGKYLNLVLWPNKHGEDEWGNTHYCVQDVSKEEREKGDRGPIVGNAKIPNNEPEPPPRRPSPPPKRQPDSALDPDDDSSEIPF